MRRALLGGSFDPVHLGHLAMADYVLTGGRAAEVHVVPAWLSPHKTHMHAPAAERLAMVRLAFAGKANIHLDERELAAGKTCYTVETLGALQAAHPGDEWLLLIGADNLPGLTTWRDLPGLLRLARFLVFARGGRAPTPVELRAAGLTPDRCDVAADFDLPVSSSAIRAMLVDRPLAATALAAGGLPATVARHIVDRRLYLPEIRPNRNGAPGVPDPD